MALATAARLEYDGPNGRVVLPIAPTYVVPFRILDPDPRIRQLKYYELECGRRGTVIELGFGPMRVIGRSLQLLRDGRMATFESGVLVSIE